MTNLPVPTEFQEGIMLVAWLRIHGYTFAHVANETGHSPEAKRRAIRVKQSGGSKGFPDYVICLPGVGMLYIELKRLKGSVTSPEQHAWIDAINQCPGSQAFICKGWEVAVKVVESLTIINPSKGHLTRLVTEF
jgi:hypothetical protein